VGGFFNYHAVPTNSRALAAHPLPRRILWGRTFAAEPERPTHGTGSPTLLSECSPSPVSHPGQTFARLKPPEVGAVCRASLPLRICAGAPSNGRLYRDSCVRRNGRRALCWRRCDRTCERTIHHAHRTLYIRCAPRAPTQSAGGVPSERSHPLPVLSGPPSRWSSRRLGRRHNR